MTDATNAEGSRPKKRQKVDHEALLPSGNIRGSFELHNLLRFSQNGGPLVKEGVNEFRRFCAEVQKNEDLSERHVQLKVLKQYCEEQSSTNGEELDFPDLLSTWSYAVQSNNEPILSAVSAALAQFFRTISSELDFREFGLSLCRTLLKRDQMKLFERGLSSPKTKQFVISPCLRLLTEIISFDGGAMVGNVFSRRDILLKRLDSLLEPTPKTEHVDRRQPTVRSNALRVVMTLMKYLDTDSKEELISQAKPLHACFKHLGGDNPRLVAEFLDEVQKAFVNSEVSKESKKRLFNSCNLGLLALLYDVEKEEGTDDAVEEVSVRDSAHRFLLSLCHPKIGLVVPQTGWYPVGFSPGRNDLDDNSAIDLGLDSPYYSDDYSTTVPIKNTALSTFIQKVKPWTDSLQAELVTRMFQEAPELVADYCCRKSRPLGTTKDTVEWRGQFAFLFQLIELPVPHQLGWRDRLPASPPPTSIVMESILPRQFDRTTLLQCLKTEDAVSIISVARVIVAAMHKLEKVLTIFRLASNELWKQAAFHVQDLLVSRLPASSEVVSALQRSSPEDHATREALLECMAVFPDVISFDTAPVIDSVLQQLRSDETAAENRDSLLQQLASLMKLMRKAKNVKWSSVIAVLAFSTSTEELKTAGRDHILPKLLEKAIIHDESSFFALLEALTPFGEDQKVLSFLENCMTRVVKQPVKYLDAVEVVQKQTHVDGHASLLACCISEQWNFVADDDQSTSIGPFAAGLFACLESIGESAALLDRLRQPLLSNKAVAKAVKKLQRKRPSVQTPHLMDIDSDKDAAHPEEPRTLQTIDLAATFPPPPPIPSSLKGLTNWDKVDIESELHAPSTSRLASLVHCLSSPSEEIRLSANQTLLSLTHAIQTSTYSEKDQLYLLLGELTETFREHNTSAQPTTPLPTLIPSLAILLLTIITSPSDPMYPLANILLLKSPTWTPLPRLLTHWIHAILLSDPETSSSTITSSDPIVFLHRFLDVLITSLRNAADLEIFRRSGIFERLCSLYLSPSTKRDARKKIFNIIYNAIIIEGGADTLITRVGIGAWLKVVKCREEGRGGDMELWRVVGALEQEVEGRKDRYYIGRWRGIRGGMKDKEKGKETGLANAEMGVDE